MLVGKSKQWTGSSREIVELCLNAITFLSCVLLVRSNSKVRLNFGGGNAMYADPDGSIVSLPSPPPLPEPLGDWYESAQVRETLESFNQNLEDAWHLKEQ